MTCSSSCVRPSRPAGAGFALSLPLVWLLLFALLRRCCQRVTCGRAACEKRAFHQWPLHERGAPQNLLGEHQVDLGAEAVLARNQPNHGGAAAAVAHRGDGSSSGGEPASTLLDTAGRRRRRPWHAETRTGDDTRGCGGGRGERAATRTAAALRTVGGARRGAGRARTAGAASVAGGAAATDPGRKHGHSRPERVRRHAGRPVRGSHGGLSRHARVF